MNVNRLILGDNLEILKGFDSECVDLIYLDPFYCSLGEKYTNDFYKYDDGDAKGLYRLGDIIAFSFNKGAIEESARLKNKENLVIKLVTVEEIVPIATKPTVSVLFEEIQRHPNGDRAIRLTATGRSEAGIEFYSWDFKHDAEKGFSPSVMIDKEGKREVTLPTGEHIIAVKVVDNEGLENVEVIRLKINGVIERKSAN